MFDESLKILISLTALLASFYLAQKLNKSTKFHFLSTRPNRYVSIDGLRGYLALSVFIHHVVLTWYWKNTGEWNRPPEAYFQNLGKFGIAIFFMITGFLFVSKILSSKGIISWYRLYQSRIFRIFPLYLFVIIVISIIVFLKSDLQISVSLPLLIKQYIKWFMFHGDAINDFSETSRIIAGVDWTLKYEWLFYALLPLLAFVIKQGRLAIMLLFIGIIILFIFPAHIEHFYTRHFILFAIGGTAAALNVKLNNRNKWVNNHYSSFVVVIALVAALFYPTTFDAMHILLMAIFFVPVALGNNLFGLFKTKASIFLGEISYSIYLLHGIVLYTLFSIINFDISHISLVKFLLWLPLLMSLVIIISTLTYLAIEKPFMLYGKKKSIFEQLPSSSNK